MAATAGLRRGLPNSFRPSGKLVPWCAAEAFGEGASGSFALKRSAQEAETFLNGDNWQISKLLASRRDIEPMGRGEFLNQEPREPGFASERQGPVNGFKDRRKRRMPPGEKRFFQPEGANPRPTAG